MLTPGNGSMVRVSSLSEGIMARRKHRGHVTAEEIEYFLTVAGPTDRFQSIGEHVLSCRNCNEAMEKRKAELIEQEERERSKSTPE